MRYDLTRDWYQPHLTPITGLLLPFSWLFGAIAGGRRWLYRTKILTSHQMPVPVIVVGNISVGGTGKTPFIIWLAEILKKEGYSPGIVSRGVGGKHHSQPYQVAGNEAASEVGDEALLLARNTACPVVLCANRAVAANFLLQKTDCNIVLSDDGLQHYGLARDINIVVVDGARRFGNQQLIPAGPLREPVRRLALADFVVVNEGVTSDDYCMRYTPVELKSLCGTPLLPPAGGKIHAVAGIGHPERFFQTLNNLGFEVIPHIFPDHYHFSSQDLEFSDDLPVVMTEKDAVKCEKFTKVNCWYLKITAKIESNLEEQLLKRLQELEK